MADTRIFQELNVNGISYRIKRCWECFSLTKEYMLALLSRDEYTPILTNKPDSTNTIYTDPISGNDAGFHQGQCICYIDGNANDDCGLSIVKSVTVDFQGTPTSMSLYNATDIEGRVTTLENIVNNGCFGNGVWYNTLRWLGDAVWDNGDSGL